MTNAPRMRLGRSRCVRAAALVTVGLAAAACDETPPPDTPLDSAQRLEACEAAHQRLAADPARCGVLERVARLEQAATRPRFSRRADCEAIFGAEACEGGGEGLLTSQWRPVLAGWVDMPPASGPRPVVRDRQGQDWALGTSLEPEPQPASGTLRPQRSGILPGGTEYDRRAPLYPDRAACEGNWERCEPTVLANRFVDQGICEAVWGNCQEEAIPDQAIAVSSGSSGGSSGGSYHGWYGGITATGTTATTPPMRPVGRAGAGPGTAPPRPLTAPCKVVACRRPGTAAPGAWPRHAAWPASRGRERVAP
jgi:hypothetical protein